MISEILFEATLIDSTNYKKLKWIRYSFYFVLLFIGGLLVEPRTQFQRNMSLQERLNLDFGNIVGLFLIIGTIAIIVYFYSIKFEEKGRISFFRNNIQIKDQFDTFLLKFNEIEDVLIKRGSTYHYEYQRDNYLFKANNWISFKYDKSIYKYEFIIDSAEKNKEFERLIRELRTERINFKYLSI